MPQGALFVGWGQGIAGREQKGLQVFNEAIQYYTRLQQQGEIDGFEPFLLEPHGGDLLGFFLLRGDRENLSRLRTSQEFIRLTTRAQLIVQDVGVVTAYTGEELNTLISDYQQQLADLA